jgi:hypothetical protein
MNNVQVTDCTEPAKFKLERVRFFNRQLLTAEDMITERDYFLQKLRRHNRFLHGWGVVCGLTVTAAPTTGANWRVQIGSGYALGPYGDEIFVGEPIFFDLAACLSGGATNPCEPGLIVPGTAGSSTTVFLAIKYAECLARPIQVAPSGCGCDNEPCQYSRIRDSFQIQCLPQLPPQPPPAQVTLCQVVQGVPAPCPPCPTNPWVVLARITLPLESTMNITNNNINNVSVRRVILSTAILQDQVVLCCCGPTPSSSSSSTLSSSSSLSFSTVTFTQQDVHNPAQDLIQVTVTVTNSGPIDAQNVDVTVDLTPNAAGNYDLVASSTFTIDNPQKGHFNRLTVLKAGASQQLPYSLDHINLSRPFTIISTASGTSTTPGVNIIPNSLFFQNS